MSSLLGGLIMFDICHIRDYIKTESEVFNMRTTTTVHWNTGEVSERHNERDEELCKNESHIDLNNEHGDSYHEVWYHSNLTDKYNEIFGEAIDEYNSKQKRKDRMIDIESYMKSVENDTRGKAQTKRVNGKKVVDEDARKGKQLSYEITVKVGNTIRSKDDKGKTQYDASGHHIRPEELPRDLQKQIHQKYCDTFQDENPNFRVVNITYHADEGFYNRQGVWEYSEPHPHIEFIPVAHGFKQGLSVQNSMNKAMKEMGFDDSDCYDKWAKKEQERLDKITQEEYEKYCKEHPDLKKSHGDLEIYHPVTDKTRSGGKSKENYALEQELDEAIHEAESIKRTFTNGCKRNREKTQDLEAQIEAQKKLNEDLQAQIEKAQNEQNRALQRQQALATRQQELEDEFQHKEDALDVQRRAYEDAIKSIKDIPTFDTDNIYITQKGKDGKFSKPVLYQEYKTNHEKLLQNSRKLMNDAELMSRSTSPQRGSEFNF